VEGNCNHTLFTAAPCACTLGLSVDTVRRLIEANRIRTVPLGNLRRIPASEVVRLSREGTSAPPEVA
jgi:excisionase family DNA binding protein